MELVLTGLYLQMLESKQSRMQQFFTIQEQKKKNSSCSVLFGPMIELFQILLNINILPKFGADRSVYRMQMKEYKQSQI